MITLQNDVAKNSLLRSAAVNIPRNGSYATTQNRGKAREPMSLYKRPHGSIGQSSHGSHNNFGGNIIKGASGSNLT